MCRQAVLQAKVTAQHREASTIYTGKREELGQGENSGAGQAGETPQVGKCDGQVSTMLGRGQTALQTPCKASG